MARIAATVGIDVGTSGTKGVLVAEDGRVLARRTLPYPLLTPRPGWTEQNPEGRCQVGVGRSGMAGWRT